MEQLILIVHVLAALGIIGLIMIQQGKGADMGASFGAGASNTLFGSTGGGNALTKTTAILATLFFVTSFGLAIVAKNKASLSGDIDIPTPVVVESKDAQAPAISDEIPVFEESATQAMEGQSEVVAPDSFDIPATDAPSATDTDSDIPKL